MKHYFITPPASVLPDAGECPAEPAQEYTIDSIAVLITACGVPCSPVGAVTGPSAIQYHFNLADLRHYSKLSRCVTAISARLRRGVILSRSDYADFALSVERARRDIVTFKRALLTPAFCDIQSPTAAVLGVDAANKAIAVDIAELPHLLIAGATGSGKTIALHTIITSMLFKATPGSLQFVMIDPKQTELGIYNGIPHMPDNVVTSVPAALSMLNNLCRKMDERYRDMSHGKQWNSRIVIVIDELADLMLTSRYEVETSIIRIAQMGRAAGIHLIIATQRPSADVITGLIKANIPARIALTMASYRDANVIEVKGADKLSGRGDALFQSADHTKAPIRLQTAYTSPQDVAAVVGYWKSPAARTRR